MRGKQIKRSLKTEDKALARRRLADLREKAGRLHGGQQRNIQFEELVARTYGNLRNEHSSSMALRMTFDVALLQSSLMAAVESESLLPAWTMRPTIMARQSCTHGSRRE